MAAADEAGSSQASGLGAARATMTAIPTTVAGEVDGQVMEAILRGCDAAEVAAESTAGGPPAPDQDAGGPAAPAFDCEPVRLDEEGGDELADEQLDGDDVAARRRRALELGAARVVPSLELADYADRLARMNGWLVSPLGEIPLTSPMIKFGYLSDYSEELAFEIRGEAGVALLGTKHFGLDLQIPWLPEGGRGAPIVAPFDGRIVRTADPAGGPFGIWLENRELNLRARLMHMDGLVVGIESGVYVQAGQQLGILGAQGSEGFPHLHLAFERLSDGARINPALFYRLRDWSDTATLIDHWYDDPAAAPALALRQPEPGISIPEGEGRVASLLRALVLALDEPLRPRALGERPGPVELPYP